MSPNLTQPRHILELTRDEKRAFIASFDLVISDMDGVLWNETEIISRASDGLNMLKSSGKKVVYVTNNSVNSTKHFEELLKDSNIEADTHDIVNPLRSIIQYLQIHNFNEKIFCIANEPFKARLRKAGYEIIDDPNRIFGVSFNEVYEYVLDNENPGAVIVDDDFNMSGPKLMRAHQYLTKNPQCLYITGASDKKKSVIPGVNILGPGYFMDLLAKAANKKPIALGKPSLDLTVLVMNRFDIQDRKRVLMIGDMLEQDIGFGKNSGFQTLLVFTGGAKRQDLDNSENIHLIPDFVANGMEDFVSFFKDLN